VLQLPRAFHWHYLAIMPEVHYDHPQEVLLEI
jgi:hypothetical protein